MSPASSLRVEACAAPVEAAVAASGAPDYELLSLAGRGTFADVWRVRDRRTGRHLALKQLRTDRSDQPAARRILENEANVCQKVQSEHVVTIIHTQFDADPPHLALEWLTGKTLEARLTIGERLFCREAIWIARQCAQGMHALLAAGYTHGDIKPSNIFVLSDGRVKLIDMGFARPDHQIATDLAATGARPLTGTPEYLAPEALVQGDTGGVTRDVYSLEVTLFRMRTGSLPIKGESVADILRQHQQSLPPRLRSLAPDVPREVSGLVQRLLSKQPLRRGGGLLWLIDELVGLELSLLTAELEPTERESTER